jgi:DNA-binding CsgD family transcriptional regulator
MDIDYIQRRSADLTELAQQAGLGLTPWADFARVLADVVPGSTSIFLQDSGNPEATSFVQHGFDIELIKTYNAHFEPLNPWNAFWASAKTGKVYRSSAVMPASSFRHTEFYNDWLARMDRRYDGIGMKLDASSEVSLMLSMQLPDAQLDEAEAVLEPLLMNIGGALIRSVSTNLIYQRQMQKYAAAAAVVDRSPDLAFAIDQYFNIIEANPDAERSLSGGGVAKSRNNKLRLASEPAQTWLRSTVRALMFKQPLAQHRLVFRHGDELFRLSVFPVPERTGIGLLLSYRYLAVVFIRNVSKPAPRSDLSVLGAAFGLSVAEIKMCEALAENLTVAEAAERLHITRETARDRLKRIFQKTGTGRQAELMAFLMRFS